MLERIKVQINGLNLSVVLNEIINNGVIVNELQIKRNKIAFFSNNNNLSKIELICKKYHKYFKIIQINPIKRLFKFIPRCFGFILAMVIGVSFLFSYNMYVFDVKIHCDSNQEFDLISVKETLKNNGVFSGMKRSDVSPDKIQKLIVSSHENISGCLIKNNGGIIDILVYPSNEKYEVFSENIYSRYNAKIKSVEVFSGKAKVKAGDIVKVGDILIENNNGASGKILAEVLFEDYLIYNENQIVEKFTGNEVIETNVSFYGKVLFKSLSNNSFSNFKKENCVFCLSKNLFLPFNFNKIIYKEIVLEEVVVPFSEKEDELKMELKNSLLKKIDAGFMINDVSYSVVTENNMTRLDCFVSIELNLAD